MYFAEINEEKICTSILQSNGMKPSETMIAINTFDTSFLGKKYENEEWVDVEPTEPEPTDEELQAEMLLMQTEIIANQNAQDEVLAEILLNQIGG